MLQINTMENPKVREVTREWGAEIKTVCRVFCFFLYSPKFMKNENIITCIM